MKNKVFAIITVVFIFFYWEKSALGAMSEQILRNTAEIAEIMLKWSPGKLIITESIHGTIIEERNKNKKAIPFALLIYRNGDIPLWKIALNQKTFQQWQDFLIKQGGRWPEEGFIIMITDKEELPEDIPLDVPAFTQSFRSATEKEKLAITIISITRMQKQEVQSRPANFSDEVLFEAITATEICNIMLIKLQGEEQDKLCVSLGIAIGSIEMNLNYKQYQEKISRIKILSDVIPFIFPEYDYLKLRDLFHDGPIIKLQSLK